MIAMEDPDVYLTASPNSVNNNTSNSSNLTDSSNWRDDNNEDEDNNTTNGNYELYRRTNPSSARHYNDDASNNQYEPPVINLNLFFQS